MLFVEFRDLLKKHFEKMVSECDSIFEIEVDKDEMWNLYLDSYPKGSNEIYKTRREFDCQCCKHFIRSIGNIAVIKNLQLITLWDLEINDDVYQVVAKALSSYLRKNTITNIYAIKENQIGTKENFSKEEDTIVKHKHLYLQIPNKFVNKTNKSIGELKGEYRDIKNVFQRSLNELTEDSILTVLELIAQKSLYKGEEWEHNLKQFLKYKKEYELLNEKEKDMHCWKQTGKVGAVIGKIRNHSIGALLVDISNNKDLDDSVRKYESIVAPTNYKRPKPIVTQKSIDEAKKHITELGYMESLNRRYASIEDISINDILFANRNVKKEIKDSNNLFDNLKQEVAINTKQFSKVEEITIENFIEKVLPASQEIEVLMENKHESNLVSLITAKSESKSMFKWNNNFSWAYTGNLTDSIKQNVKTAGGKVDGVLRFSIQWNDIENDKNDLDAHCIEPNDNHIYFRKKYNCITGGRLDIDIIKPSDSVVAVENIAWSDISKMEKGKYLFYVHNYTNRGGCSGFRAEIEFNGKIYNFNYNKQLRGGETVKVAIVTLEEDNTFNIKELISSTLSAKTVWNIKTNSFIPVSTIMYSPNYWNQEKGIGNKHYLFMLKDCINPELVSGFYNEYLDNELLLPQNKRFFELLSSKSTVEKTENQLSGIGFSSTQRNDLIVKVKGASERTLKIKF